MAMILVLDDCIRNAEKLSEHLRSAGHEAHIAVDIGEARAALKTVRDRCSQPLLCLVELVRWRENGFTLAAALAAREHVRVVLISDREQGSDLPWALARGIEAVVTRRRGLPAMMLQITRLLVAEPAQAPASHPGPDCHAQAEPGSGGARGAADRVTTDRVTTDRVTTDRGAIDEARAALAAELHKCVSAIVTLAGPVREDSSRAIEDWFVRGKGCLEPLLTVLAFLPGACEQASVLMQNESPRKFLAQLLALQHQLAFYPAMLSGPTAAACIAREGEQACAEYLGSLLCVVLRKSLSAGEQTRALREILRTGLALQTVALAESGRYSRRVLEPWIILVAVLLHMPALRTENGLRQLAGLLAGVPAGVLAGVPAQNCDAEPVTIANGECHLTPETRRLVSEVTESALQGRVRSIHASVGLYKLACYLRMLDTAPVLLCSAVSSLYVSFCYRETLAPGEVQPLLLALRSFVSDDGNPHQHLYRILRYEVCSVVPALNDDEQVALASQLHLLPRPVSWLRELNADHRQMDLLVRDVSRELSILGEGAGRLDVPEIESLSLMLLRVYALIERTPGFLHKAAVRQRLARAHRSLCRMLDQAAAWQPVSRAGHMIESLCAVLDDMPLQGTSAVDGVRDEPLSDTSAWLHCQAVNQRLRAILRDTGASGTSRSVIIELLRSQNDVIRRQLTQGTYSEVPYQQGR